MTFGEKLKGIRKEAGMSQELLAEKLGVSRQAVTKWETDKGIPDIENVIVISNLFGISLDELLSDEKESSNHRRYLYESKTEYDIDGVKKFDIKLGGASNLLVKGTDSEKIEVLLGSNEIETVKEDFKVKIDDIKKRIDVEVNRKNNMTEAKAKEGLAIEILLPNKYLDHVEIQSNCHEVDFTNITCEGIEFNGKVSKCNVDSVEGNIELDSNLDMEIELESLQGAFELNQVSSTSKIKVPSDYDFNVNIGGIKTSISYQQNGMEVQDFSTSESQNTIGFNGINSELIISRED
jgi:transcriptional regulator with XRE-family HTH domain